MTEPPYAGRVLNVSVMGGFAYADTPFNGLTVVVTATDQQAADALAREIAEAGWARRERFRPRLTSLEDATRLAVATGGRRTLPLPPTPCLKGRGSILIFLTRSPSPTWPTIPAAAVAATPCGSSKPSTKPACATP